MTTETVTQITQEQINYGIQVGDAIQADKKANGFKDKGGHAQKNPDKSSHMGYIGETFFADLHGLDRPELIEGGLDDGFDFELDGKKVQVKTTETPYLILFPDNFARKKPDEYVCIRMDFDAVVSGKDRSVEVHHVPREEFEENCGVRNFGYGKRLVYRLD